MVSNLVKESKTNFKKILYDLRWRTGVPIFVFQMGKVASSSIYRSLFEQYLKGNVVHGHHFKPTHYYWQVEKLYKYYSSEKPIKLISPIREPISRNISAFFHNSYHNPDKKRVDFSLEKTSIDDLKKIFLKHYDHEWPLNWFDNNIKKHFNIDVYESKFPESGYQYFKKGNTELVVFKHNLNDKLKEEIIKDLTGLKSFHLNNINRGAEKAYSSKYKKFKKKVLLPDWYLDKMIQSKYVQHFFSDKEIRDSLSRWKNY